MSQIFRFRQAAERISQATGLPTSHRTVRNWTDQYPGLKAKVAGRVGLRAETLDLIASGVPLREVEARTVKRHGDNGQE